MTDFNQRSQKVDTQYNAGNNQFIQNIVLVGQFLDFAKIEGLIPRISNPSDFQSVISAFENTFDKHLGNDLAHATAAVGDILKESITKWTPKNSFSALPLKTILKELPNDIYVSLCRRNLWDAFFESNFYHYRGYHYILGDMQFIRFHSTEILWKKHFKTDCIIGIGHLSETESYFFFKERTLPNYLETLNFNLISSHGLSGNPFQLHLDMLNVESTTYEHFRVLMAGIVIDLIRISSIAFNDVKFWKNIAGLLEIEKAG